MPKPNEILLLGNFNGCVGQNNGIWREVLGKHGVGQSNSNGMRLLTRCSEHSLTITNTIFQQKTKYKKTWMLSTLLQPFMKQRLTQSVTRAKTTKTGLTITQTPSTTH